MSFSGTLDCVTGVFFALDQVVHFFRIVSFFDVALLVEEFDVALGQWYLSGRVKLELVVTPNRELQAFETERRHLCRVPRLMLVLSLVDAEDGGEDVAS